MTLRSICFNIVTLNQSNRFYIVSSCLGLFPDWSLLDAVVLHAVNAQSCTTNFCEIFQP